MSDRTARVILTADPGPLEAGMARASAATDASAVAMGDAMDGATTKVGNSVSGLGSKLEALGIPGAAAFDKIGSKISEADTHGQKFMQTMSTLGGVTLAAGAAGFVAVAAESVKLADAFDVAQAQVQNAVKTSGESFAKVKPSIDATYESLTNLGFTSTQSAQALTPLIIATGNTKKAEEDLGIAADLARAKHISLSAAAGIVTKTLAGSTRGLTALGLNLDIGSGKLKTIATDTTAYQKAQSNLDLVNKQVADGILKGANAYTKLSAAHQAVDTTSQKLALDQGTIAKILDTVKEKTQGAADAYGKTLSGQMEIAKAKADDLGVQFGQVLIPKLLDAEQAVEGVVGWFEQHKTAAEALAIVIGTTLAGAVAVFTVNTAVGMVGSLKSAATSVGILSASEEVASTDTAELTAAIASLEAALIPVAAAEQSVATAQEAVDAAWAEAAGLADQLDADIVVLTGSYERLGLVAEGTTAELEASSGGMAAAGDSAGAEGLAGGLGESGAAAGGLLGVLGPLSLAVGAVTVGAIALGDALHSNTNPAWINQVEAVKTNATTISGMQTQLGKLESAQDAASKAIGNGTLQAQVAPQAYAKLGDEIDTMKGKLAAATTNMQELGNITGLSGPVIQNLATTLGVNLTQALSPATIEKFTTYVQANGGAATVTGQQWTAAAALIQAALEKTEAQATQSMPNISKAAQTMVATTQPKLVELVSDLNKTGDKAGAGFVSAFLANLTPAELASKQMHDAVKSPLVPLEADLRAIGDNAAANQIAAFISHAPAAAVAAYTMSGSILGPLNGIVAAMHTTGDEGGMNLVQSFLQHNPGALAAANEMKGSIASKLQPLEDDLLAVGDTSGANIVAGIMKHDSAAQQQAQFLHDAIKHPLDPLMTELGVTGDTAATALITDFEKHHPEANTAAGLIHDAITGQLMPLESSLQTIGDTSAANMVAALAAQNGPATTAASALGAAIDSGLASGITVNNGVAINAVQGVVQQVITAGKTGLKAASPSKVFAEIGTWIPLGLAQGIDAATPSATASIQRMTASAIGAANFSAPGGPSFASSGLSGGSSVPVGGGSGGAGTPLIIQIDGQQIAHALLTPLQVQGALLQRTQPQTIFGVAQVI